MDDSLGEYDLTYFEVDLLIFKYFDLLDPPADSYILEDVDSDVDYC